MNKQLLKQLVEEADRLDPQNEILEEENRQKRLNEMIKNLTDTIDYLNTCSEKELFWATEVLEDLSEHFKSKKLLECVKRNKNRFSNNELQKQLEMVLGYMKTYL